jgi:hypothetical protein
MSKKAVIGIFDHATDAAVTVDRLVERGIAPSRISVAATESTARESLGFDKDRKGAEGTAWGGGVGAAAGALLAGLTSVGAIASGGAGLLVTGPLVAIFTGAGAGGAAGGILGGLIGLGFSEEKVEYFEDRLGKGAAMVAVNVDGFGDGDRIDVIFEEQSPVSVTSA